jgi:Xaa-Pro aminopeptidase
MTPETRTTSSAFPRIARLRKAMAAEGIDVLLCFKPENSFALSGFNPIIYSHPVIAILPAEGDVIMLVHALRDDHGRASSFARDIRLYGAWSNKVTMGPSWLAATKAILDEGGLAGGTVGIEEDFMPVTRYRTIAETLPDATLRNVSPMIEHVRRIKDPDQIELARIAAKIADIGMDAAIAAVAAGGSERDVAAASMHAMNTFWAASYPDVEVCDFGTLEGGAQNGLWAWCLAGDRMFMNCDNPTQRVPVKGEPVSLFIWSVANGCHAENERTVAVGPLPPEKKKGLDDILKIRSDMARLIRPGTPVAELVAATRVQFEAHGYAGYIPGRLGHGIGIGAHEHWSLDAVSKDVLEPGMIFTWEPNLRVPGVCATQYSDTLLVTEGGHESLTRSRCEYIEV